MTRQQKIEKMQRAGFKVTFQMRGGVSATKLQREYKAESVTALHKQIYGY